MNNIFTSNHIEILCQTLSGKVQEPGLNIFDKQVIITQSNGMSSWLKTELAKQNGVFANFEFYNQDSFLQGIYQLLFKERLQNNLDEIKYKIYKCLDSTDFKKIFPEISHYYESDELRRMQLSGKIADLFDQYQLYRPEMITNWEREGFSTENSVEKWQLWIWKQLGIESRTKIRRKILDQLVIQQELIKRTYPSISLFGITDYTQYHLDFFNALAKYITVNFYLCLPTEHKQFQNELLVSYGKKAFELANMFKFTDYKIAQNVGDSLLTQIQDQILNNRLDLEWKKDDSVQVNSCYTPAREVECLYNYLLDLFQKDNKLQPRDVLVITTDINKYAPFIKAVFQYAPVKIPFQVSGADYNSDNTIVSTLEQIISFTEDDFTSEKVISLLEQKRIKQHFGIQDCNYIRSVLNKANIRFGRENRSEDDTKYVSWKYGLEKILLGYSMLTDKEYKIGEDLTIYPFKDSEASGSYDLLRLKAFVAKLESVIDNQNKFKTLTEWKKFLFEEVIEKLIYRDDYDKEDRVEKTSIDRAVSFINNIGFDEKVSFEVFLSELKTKLFVVPRVSKLNTGRVTVSSPVPVRGLPYKIICFLGLNNDIFPRKDKFMGFDLLGEQYNVGDRNIKETDKYIFIETLLSAREKLYMSYIGQSANDNTEIPPSIVLDILLDYLGPEMSIIKHPLHGFSSIYQKADKRLFTYLYSKPAKQFTTKVDERGDLTEISVYSFVKFFEHPIEWYFNTILGIRYEEDEYILPETELFELDYLQKWIIKSELVELKDEDLETYLQKSIKEGLLPLKNLGKVTLENLVNESSAIKSTYHKLVENKEELNVLVDIEIENIQIKGTIGDIYDRQFILCSFSKSPKKNLLRAYIKTLLLYANSEIDGAQLINKDGKVISLKFFTSDEAKSRLSELMFYFKKGTQEPLKFTLKATQPPSNKNLNIDTVRGAFKEEVFGNYSVPPNKYMLSLFNEGYFDGFNEDDFDDLKNLTSLLNLNTD